MTKLRLVAGSLHTAPKPSAAPRARRATPKSEQTRVVILEAAIDTLDRHGYHGANLARIADMAGVTRGCLQYYYMTSSEIMLATASYMQERRWDIYEDLAMHPPDGSDRIEHAIDLLNHRAGDRYRAAHLELVTAARTTPELQAALRESAKRLEARATAFTARMFGNDLLADTPQFRAAREMTILINDWLFVHVWGGDQEERAAELMVALKIFLKMLWRMPDLDASLSTLKPRIRVPARSQDDN